MVTMPPPPNSIRPPAHEPLPRGTVRGRNGELLTRQYRGDNMPDQYDVPMSCREPGWSMQWVRVSCHGEDDAKNYNAHYANGWRPVPADRLPDEFNSSKQAADAIVRDGLMLMERPDTLTQEATSELRSAAHRQKHNMNAEFKGTEKILDETAGSHHGSYVAATPDVDSRGLAKPVLNRTVEPVPQNLYPHREYAVEGDE